MSSKKIALAMSSLFAILPSGLQAKDGERLPNFTQLCVEDEAIGFYWEEKRWVPAKFKTSKYIVSKIDRPNFYDKAEKDEENNRIYIECYPYHEESVEEGVHSYNDCIKIQEFGEKWYEYFRCVEWHFFDYGESKWNISIDCRDNLTFEPNGEFHKTFFLSSLRSDVVLKDRLSISVGKCASLDQ